MTGSELDTALESTNLTDSINRTWLRNHVPVNITEFIIFADEIRNISIVNSSNTSIFTTGILWDQSDDAPGVGNGEFNGSEDVVFITGISRAQPGLYGVYDFEVKVPSTLRDYKGPDQNSVTFYVELT